MHCILAPLIHISSTFISQARKFQPYVPRELADYIVTAYTNMRREESQATEEFTYTTARTLLGILRLSTALVILQLMNVVINLMHQKARVRFDEEVTQSDIDEAIRLMHVSKASLLEEKRQNQGLDATSAIFDIIRRMGESSATKIVSCDEIIPRIVAKGFTQQQLDTCLDEYETLNVWQISHNRAQLKFV